MNFLALAQRLRQEAGLSGSGPATVSGQAGQLRVVVDTLASAWRDLQRFRPNWQWMWRQFSFSTAIAKRDYTPTEAGCPDLGRLDEESCRIYKQADGVAY